MARERLRLFLLVFVPRVVWDGACLEGLRVSDWLKRRSPAIEIVPIINTRISHTITATKMGTILSSVPRATTALPKVSWFKIAIETPHHVSIAFINAANIQAPNRYQTSVGSSDPCSGVNNLAIPAKSIPQNAMDKIVAHRTLKNFNSPNRSLSAKSVVE
jgi:hypothetical protein